MKTILFAISVALSAFLVLPAQAAKVSPTEISGAVTVDAAQAKELFDRGVIFVDVRKKSDWDAGRIPGAKHIELKKKYNEASLGKVIAKGNWHHRCRRSDVRCRNLVELPAKQWQKPAAPPRKCVVWFKHPNRSVKLLV